MKNTFFATLVLCLAFGVTKANYATEGDVFKQKPTSAKKVIRQKTTVPIITGADQTDLYIDYLKGKNVGMVVNQTSVIGKSLTPSPDSLLKRGVLIKKIFGPEHGFRGNAANGARVADEIDAKTGVPVVSLYGKHYKPTDEDLKGLDIIVFDIQDVGTRFYTYISTLHYVMEACAEHNVELMILDRPNPNGYLVDGPVMTDTTYKSFVGMHPIPAAHGMTIGEYAQMINGEGWLKNKVKCQLKVIKLANYKHNMAYQLPVWPSPNLNSQLSILLYPSICLFEGTTLSLGRGTQFPFTVVGHPSLKGKYTFSFTPISIPGVSDNPPLKGQTCYGIDLRNFDAKKLVESKKLNLAWLIELYKAFPDKSHFFNAYINKLWGSEELRKQVEAGKTESEIRQSWEPALSRFKEMRKKYLLYQ
ncbi:DUF1343 domain-containing protein [Mucilaginibacter sp. RS28]|uniref:DUF1343 domain-containing protein n=1 Tax=Mucilaginibacter straminoryzae TaxID=2932774 RepID=A0A9X1X336_9SPHI|nr:DUF1343 domain-containing protein [Mucilaginibacter straminoryzae]MCJ8210098.1 DUF1343 domain-containing protein [Mucilaginibacter straminoryzae]